MAAKPKPWDKFLQNGIDLRLETMGVITTLWPMQLHETKPGQSIFVTCDGENALTVRTAFCEVFKGTEWFILSVIYDWGLDCFRVEVYRSL